MRSECLPYGKYLGRCWTRREARCASYTLTRLRKRNCNWPKQTHNNAQGLLQYSFVNKRKSNAYPCERGQLTVLNWMRKNCVTAWQFPAKPAVWWPSHSTSQSLANTQFWRVLRARELYSVLRISARTQTRSHTHTHIYIYMCVCVCVCMCVCVHIT